MHLLQSLTDFSFLVRLRVVTCFARHDNVSGIQGVKPAPMASLARLSGKPFSTEIRFELAYFSWHVTSATLSY